jgi:hypothetical protein
MISQIPRKRKKTMKEHLYKSVNHNGPGRGPRGPRTIPITWPPAWLAEPQPQTNPTPEPVPAAVPIAEKAAAELCQAACPEVPEPPDSGQPTCPSCRRPLDRKQRCWKCCDRLCADCGGRTGSAFIMYCVVCEVRLQAAGGDHSTPGE